MLSRRNWNCSFISSQITELTTLFGGLFIAQSHRKFAEIREKRKNNSEVNDSLKAAN